MYARYEIMCGCECCISAKSIHSSLLSWRDRYLENIKDQSQNVQSRKSGKKSHHIYTTYKNTVMPHGSHIYAKVSDMANATMWHHCIFICCIYVICFLTIFSALRILALILESFQNLSRQDINDECIILAEMQHSQPHIIL